MQPPPTVAIENDTIRIDARLLPQEGECGHDRPLGIRAAEIRRSIRSPEARLRDSRRGDIQTGTEPKQRARIDGLFRANETAALIAVHEQDGSLGCFALRLSLKKLHLGSVPPVDEMSRDVRHSHPHLCI